jgi:cobyrinic acid a,c-diamide synthase
VLAGAGSNTGKTTLTAGIIAAFRRRGLNVRPFKVGPDFTDAAYLAHVAGQPCRNLDPWLLGSEVIMQSFHRGCAEGDLAVVEGMLGLFDSWGAGTAGSTAQLSKLINSPVILVLDVAETVQNAAAVALGMRSVDPDVRIAGVILNRIHDAEHARWVEEAVWELSKLPVLGSVPLLGELDIPEARGMLTPVEQNPAFEEGIDALVAAVERHVNLDVLLRIAERAQPLRDIPRAAPIPASESVRLGVGYDDAFSLYYPENLEILAEAGAEIIPFSPLADHNIPRVDGVYLAGAASERFAAQLSGNTRMLESLREASLDGVPVYAECGGLMYLAESVSFDGDAYPMAGLLPISIEADAGARRMGYRQLRAIDDCMVAAKGQGLRGHEYHWSRITNGKHNGLRAAYELSDPSGYLSGHEGYARPGLLASNIHLHFAQNPELALNLLRACAHLQSSEALV